MIVSSCSKRLCCQRDGLIHWKMCDYIFLQHFHCRQSILQKDLCLFTLAFLENYSEQNWRSQCLGKGIYHKATHEVPNKFLIFSLLIRYFSLEYIVKEVALNRSFIYIIYDVLYQHNSCNNWFVPMVVLAHVLGSISCHIIIVISLLLYLINPSVVP